MSGTSTSMEHVGEWKVAITAGTLEELFAEVARVIARAAGEPVSRPRAWEALSVTARDLPSLLADWANELLGKSESEMSAYGDVRNILVSRGDGSSTISAEVRGRPLDRWGSPLKAATYHELSLEKRGAAWHGVILFDV